jgi:predicted Zn-dependent protease
MRALPLAIAVLASSLAHAEPPQRPSRALVVLVVVGRFPQALIAPIAAELERELDVQVYQVPDLPFPDLPYREDRRATDSGKLLDYLESTFPGSLDARVLALTDYDLRFDYPEDSLDHSIDGALDGQAKQGGRVGVITIFNAKCDLRRMPFFPMLVSELAIHEVGHELGLGHFCSPPPSVMYPGASLPDAEGHFHVGERCRAELDRRSPIVAVRRHLEVHGGPNSDVNLAARPGTIAPRVTFDPRDRELRGSCVSLPKWLSYR